MNKKAVAHLTSVHMRFDTRIFHKQCKSLAAAGYYVSLIVADGEGDEFRDDIQILDVGRAGGRVRRMALVPRRILARALDVDASIYHIHDPELLTIASGLQRNGKVVIFDAHEDVSAQILGKSYVHPAARRLLSKLYGMYEGRICPKLDAVIAATPFIRNRLDGANQCLIDVNNYPILGELMPKESADPPNRYQVCYAGIISEGRGIQEIVRAMKCVRSDTRLVLCGSFSEEAVSSKIKNEPGWERVDAVGWLDRRELRCILNAAVAGLVIFHALPNHINAQPNKLFEYMSAMVPVIASDFPLWREIVQGSDCGICVDPGDPNAIAEAIDYLVTNPARAEEMGANGRIAVEQNYNWAIEEKKLLELYEQLGQRFYA